jgi:hypothetical protein
MKGRTAKRKKDLDSLVDHGVTTPALDYLFLDLFLFKPLSFGYTDIHNQTLSQLPQLPNVSLSENN